MQYQIMEEVEVHKILHTFWRNTLVNNPTNFLINRRKHYYIITYLVIFLIQLYQTCNYY